MELTAALEQYLLDTRQVDPLARRQARLLRESAGDREDEAGIILLLVLAALHRGSPRSGKGHLLSPLAHTTVSRNAEECRRTGVSDAPWEQDLVSNETSFTETITRLFDDPSRLAPLSGQVPSGEAVPWPILTVDKEFAGFSRYMHSAAILEEKHLPVRLGTVDTGADPDAIQAALCRVFVEQPALKKGDCPHCRQVAAAALACRTRFLIVSGGPGTGKTTVVLQLLRTLLAVFTDITADRIALCAPTGRAKARLVESLGNGLDMLHSGTAGHSITAKTIQGLLIQQSDGTCRYNRDNRLPHRVVVVDEASMMDINLFAALLEAISGECRLILVGDMHQLPSVEAGAPLGDLTERFSGIEHAPTLSRAAGDWLGDVIGTIPMEESGKVGQMLLDGTSGAAEKAGRLTDHAVILTKSYRLSQETILDLANAVNSGTPDRARQLLPAAGKEGATGLITDDGTGPVETWFKNHFESDRIQKAYELLTSSDTAAPDAPEVIGAIAAILFVSSVLTLVHEGTRGRHAINAIGEKLLRKEFPGLGKNRFFHGLPVILGTNHHDLGLYNGDLGMVVNTPRGQKVLFPGETGCRIAAPDRLRGLEPAFALTVHKAQGSEFDNVLLVLPDREGPLLTRQIIYTGITRAKKQVRVLGSEAIFRKAVEHREQREGGVRI